jgi:hypothetical protein
MLDFLTIRLFNVFFISLPLYCILMIDFILTLPLSYVFNYVYDMRMTFFMYADGYYFDSAYNLPNHDKSIIGLILILPISVCFLRGYIYFHVKNDKEMKHD